MVKASTYYTLGAIRVYDENENIYPIKFVVKDQLLENTFHIDGTSNTGKVYTTNSYSSYYYVDSPFDTDKPIVTAYVNKNYWLSGSADTIRIKFDNPILISKIEFVPYCGDGETRKQNSVSIECIDESGTVVLSEFHDTKSYLANQVYTVQTPDLTYIEKSLLKSRNKIYSFQTINAIYHTSMTSNTLPTPFIATASSQYDSTNYVAWKAFNGTTNSNTDCWASISGTTTGWIQIDFGTNKLTNYVYLTSRNNTDLLSFPRKINILGSYDGVSFNRIKQVDGLLNPVAQTKVKIDFKTSNYRYYRIEILQNNGEALYTAIGDILYGFDGSILYNLPKISEENFIKYGKREMLYFSTPIKTSAYILQDDSSKNLDGLWTTKLDRKPLSIGFRGV